MLKSTDQVITVIMIISRPSGRIGLILHATLVIVVLIVPMIFVIGVQVPNRNVAASFTTPAMWPVYGHDSQRTSRTDHAGPAAPLLRWSVGAAPRVQNGVPIVVGSGGMVYVGSDAGLISIDPQTGVMRTLWQLQDWSVYAVAILSDGTLLAGANFRVGVSSEEHGTVFAFSQEGAPKWNFTLTGNIYNQMAVSRNDTIYALTSHGPLYSINSTGALRWMRQVSGSNGGVALARNDTVYASTESNLTAYHPDGQTAWSIPIWVDDQLVVHDDGTILAIGYQCPSLVGICYPSTRTLFALNPNGTTRWSLEPPSSPPSLGWDGTIYLPYDNDFRALNSSGTQKWTMALKNAGNSTAIVDANSNLYACSSDGITSITSDGSVRWKVQDVGYPVAIAADGTLYYYYYPTGLVGSGIVGALAATDFVVTANPNLLTIVQGARGFSTVTITPRFGFPGNVTLSLTVSPSGPVVSLASSIVPGGSGNDVMTIDVDNAVPVGTYTVNISGSSGNLAHSYQVIVLVYQPQGTSDSSFLGLSPETFYMLAGAIPVVIVAVAGTLVILRRRRNSRV